MAITTFQYQTFGSALSSAWTTETQKIWTRIIDAIGIPMYAEIAIANPLSARESTYTAYQRVRITEADTNEIIFYGKIESVNPEFDPVFGQVLILKAKDNLQELMKRILDTDYTSNAFTRRSDLIEQIVIDHSFVNVTKNIDTTNAAKFEDSAVIQAATVLDVDFAQSAKPALVAISALAQEDPHDTAKTNFAYDYYLDATFSGNTPTPFLHYFKRGTRPAGGPSANGLTVEYKLAAETDQKRAMLPDYSFTKSGKERVTKVRFEYQIPNGATFGRIVHLLDTTVSVGTFIEDETVTGAGLPAGTTVEFVGAGYLVVTWSSTVLIIGGVITGSSSGATATLEAVPRQTLGMDVERVLQAYETTSHTKARAKAAEILFKTGDEIIRGEFGIVRWPYFTILGATTLVRAGHVIRVINADSITAQDMTVTEIRYDEGPGSFGARISTVGTTRGESILIDIISKIQDGIEDASFQSPTAIGGMPVATLPVSIDFQFTSVDFNTVSWPAGNVSFADGRTAQAINASIGPTHQTIAGTMYCFVIVGNATLQFSTSFATTQGLDRALIAIMKDNATGTEDAHIVSVNAGSPVVVAGTLIANELSAITANMGVLTAGAILMTAGTPSVATPVNGLLLDSEKLAGYSGGVLQVEIRAQTGGGRTAGTLYAGAGAVIIDSTGIRIDNSTGSGNSTFRFTGLAGVVDSPTVRYISALDGMYHNVPTGEYHIFSVANVRYAEIKSYGVKFPSSHGAYTNSEVLLRRDSSNLQLNVNTGQVILFTIFGVTTMHVSGGGIEFPNGLTNPAGTVHFINRDTSHNLNFNVPTGESINFMVNNLTWIQTTASGFIFTSMSAAPSGLVSYVSNPSNVLTFNSGGVTGNESIKLAINGGAIVTASANGLEFPTNLTAPAGTVTYITRSGDDILLNISGGNVIAFSTSNSFIGWFEPQGLTLNGSALAWFQDDPGVPAGTGRWITSNNGGDVILNVPSTKAFHVYVNGVDQFGLAAGGLIYATGAIPIAGTFHYIYRDTNNDFIYNVAAGDIHQFRVNGTGYVQAGAAGLGVGNVAPTGSGVNIGVASTNNDIWNVSQGAGTNTLWIGNASINVTSDIRLKKGVVPTGINAYEKFRQLKVVDYIWNDPYDSAPVNKNSRGTWTGMIAQDMVDIIPWIVNAPDRTCQTCRAGENCLAHDSYWFVDLPHMAGLFVKGFQETDDRIKELEAEVATLKTRLGI